MFVLSRWLINSLQKNSLRSAVSAIFVASSVFALLFVSPTNAQQISAGLDFSCAVMVNGKLCDIFYAVVFVFFYRIHIRCFFRNTFMRWLFLDGLSNACCFQHSKRCASQPGLLSRLCAHINRQRRLLSLHFLRRRLRTGLPVSVFRFNHLLQCTVPTGVSHFISVGTGYYHSCGVLANNTAVCW